MPVGLLERGALLTELQDALTASASGGRAVLVAGEAGIGKSALLRAFMRSRAGEGRFLVGLCDPLLTPRALGPLHDIARQTGGALATTLAQGAAREAVFAAFLDELGAGPRRQMVVVEDAHWADEATLDLLVFLGRRLEEVPAALVVTFRDDELVADHPLRRVLAGLPADRVQHVRPTPLSEAAVAELARRAGAASDGLHALTGGNPLLVTELLASGSTGVPATVHDLTVARSAALPPQAQEVVRLVAVVPTVTELWLLADALHPAAEVVESCVAAGLLVLTDESVAFRHELIRRAVESSLSPLRRRELNGTVLRTLTSATDRTVDPARLAHHAREADDGAAVLLHAPAAAQAAAALGAHREAAGHFRAALEHADGLPGPDRAALLEGLSFQAYLVGRSEEALTSRLEALGLREAARQTLETGDDWRWLSRVHWWIGNRDRAEAAAASAIEVLEGAPPGRQLAMAYSNQSQLDMLARRSGSAIDWGTRALALARAVDDHETVAHALTNIGTARLNLEDGQGTAELEEAFELAVREDLPDHAVRAVVNLGYTHLELRDYRRAGPELDRALRFAVEHELSGYAEYVLGTRAWFRFDQGDWAGAERDALDALDRPQQPGIPLMPALVAWGRLQVRRGDEGAAETLRQAAQRAYGTAEVQRIGPVAAARAEHAWLHGRPERAAEEARRGLPTALESEHRWFTGELAWWLHRSGAPTAVPDWVAEPYRCSLDGDWRSAAEAWAELGCPYEEAEALAASDDDEALLRALERFDGLGAVPAARLVRRRLTERGRVRVPRGPRQTTVGNPAGLTARQLDVLGLVADGLSNAGIAARLSLSVRTVDHHVSAVLAKLGVDSRSHAVDAAQRLGVVPARDPDRDGHRVGPT